MTHFLLGFLCYHAFALFRSITRLEGKIDAVMDRLD